MKTILVPVDFSKSSMYSAEAAGMLARKSGATVHLLNVVSRPDFLVTADPMFYTMPAAALLQNSDDNLKKNSNKSLQRLAARNWFQGLKVKCEVIDSAVVHDEIIRHASRIKSHLIVIGSKGASGLKNILLGSTAERVVRFSEHPVLVIPSRLKKREIRSVVFASDFHDEAYGIFPFVKKFAGILGAEIELLKINTIEQFNSTADNLRLMKNFNRYFKSNYKINIYDDFMKEEGILHFAGDSNMDLIALGTHGKRGLIRFFRADISGGMVRLSQKPILVVNIKKYKQKSDLK